MNAIDLFSGCGGLSLGFMKAGYTIKKAVEYDPAIANTYKLNHPEVEMIVDDITNIDMAGTFKKGDADIIIGGPPCQGFSMAGARIRHGFIDDPRNYLFKHYFNVVKEIRPKFFVMENVKGMLTMQKGLLRVERNALGRRNYSENDVEWVKFIKRLKDTGMLLRDIKRYSDLRYQGDETMGDRMELLISHRKSVIEEQTKWAEYLANLDEKIGIYRKQIELESIERTKQGFEEIFKTGDFYNKQTQDDKHLERILDYGAGK